MRVEPREDDYNARILHLRVVTTCCEGLGSVADRDNGLSCGTAIALTDADKSRRKEKAEVLVVRPGRDCHYKRSCVERLPRITIVFDRVLRCMTLGVCLPKPVTSGPALRVI